MKIYSKIISFLFFVGMLAVAFWGYMNIRYFQDIYAFKTAEPNSVAAIYSGTLNLTERAKPIFYGTYPSVDNKLQFNVDCKPAKTVSELGCYDPNSNRIYALAINQPELATMTNVAMAHEFLHAVYERLDKNQLSIVNQLVEEELANNKNDSELQKRLEMYAKTEPGSQDNELFSIFGSEFPSLIPKLENEYDKYFQNRQIIVSWHQENVNLINTKEQTLKTEKQQLDNNSSNLDSLDAKMARLKAQGLISAYNSLVSEQNALVEKLRNEAKEYNQNVVDYNDMIASINNNSYSSYDLNLESKQQ